VKRSTITDVARAAGVSVAAASYALNGRPGVSDATRERVLAAARDLHWRPNVAARSLSSTTVRVVGIASARRPEDLGLEHFFMQFLSGLQRELADRQIGVLLQLVADHDAAVETYRTWRAEGRVDGVVVMDLWPDDVRLDALAELALPAVAVCDPSAAGAFPAIWSDDATSHAEAVAYLVGLGHRHVGRVTGISELAHTAIRSQAVRRAADDLGVRLTVADADYSPESGALATRRLLALADPPTAILYDNDAMAVAALDEIRRLRLRVPQDVSVLAGDDSAMCQFTMPTLTALSRDTVGYGRDAGRVLLDLLTDGEATTSESPRSTLVVRQSTAAPPAR